MSGEAAGSANNEIHIHLGVMDKAEDDLRGIRSAVLKYPLAARGFYRAMVEEGRRYAKTAEGARLLAHLEGSELAERGQTIASVLSSDVLHSRDSQPLPSAIVDAILYLVRAPDLEEKLSRLIRGKSGGA